MHDIDCVISMVLSNNGSLKIAKTLSSNCLKDHEIKFKKPKESAVGYSLVIFLKQSKSLRSVCFYQISSVNFISLDKTVAQLSSRIKRAVRFMNRFYDLCNSTIVCLSGRFAFT